MLADALRHALDVRRGEEREVALLVGHAFWVGFALVFLETVATALFLSRFEVALVPVTYVAVAIVVSVFGWAWSMLEARVSPGPLLLGTLGLLAVIGISLHALIVLRNSDAAVFALMVWTQAATVLGGLELWALAGRLFDLRQGKRLFGLVAAGEVVAWVAGGASVSLLVAALGTTRLLWLSLVGWLGCLGVLATLLRRSPLDAEEEEDQPVERDWSPLGASGYLRRLFGFVTASVIGYYLIDYLFYAQLKVHYADQDRLATALGFFFAVVGGLTLLVQTFLSGRLLDRFGLPLTLGILPAAILMVVAGTGAALGLGAVGLFFGLVIAAKAADEVLRTCLEEQAVMVLYQPLPPARRTRAQAMVQSLVRQVATGLSGLLLIGLASLGDARSRVIIGLLGAVVIAWLVLGWSLARAYVHEVASALARHSRLGLFRRGRGMTAALAGPAARRQLLAHLESEHAGEVLYALEHLDTAGRGAVPKDVADAIPRLLAHPAPEVRRHALDLLERGGADPRRVDEVVEVLDGVLESESDPRVLSRALSVLGAVAQHDGVERLERAASDPAVRGGALAGLLRTGSVDGTIAAGVALKELVASSRPADRILACDVLAAVAHPTFTRPLETLLRDADVDVRRAALKSAAKVASPRLWRSVARGLFDSHTRAEAAASLVVGGEAVLDALSANVESAPAAVRGAAATVVGRIGGERAQRWLVEHAERDIEEVRERCLEALVASASPIKAALRPSLSQLIQTELDEAAWACEALADLPERPELSLLREAIEHGLAGRRQRVLLLLALGHDRKAVLRARVGLADADPERQALALETLDNLLDGELKAQVFPLLEPQPPEELRRLLVEREAERDLGEVARLRAIAEHSAAHMRAWTRAVTLLAIGQRGLGELGDCLDENVDNPRALVAETARWALARLDGSADAKEEEMPSIVHRVLVLRTVPMFARANEDDLAELAAMIEEIELDAGTTFIHAGEVGREMYVLVSGAVRVHVGENVINERRARTVVGEMSALDPAPRSASVTTTEPSLLYRIDEAVLGELMAQYPGVARGIIAVLCKRLREASAGSA